MHAGGAKGPATLLWDKKRYDFQCYGDGKLHILGRLGNLEHRHDTGYNPSRDYAGSGIAPAGDCLVQKSEK